ncbi:uncharacterized protein PV07_08666 [Cladophialophora immunda]|uniref:JmjC domain-containing protein n=1 Tax=Cladophialophora immunda TaxID=569365 RepID=A0A0D2C4Z8_9EURO|nr:uncharacterized protein PV07_08666 [Cladophialophora immunda]KIW25500.1 hypothetical protein PV07_08666 [Cladophialophora immunda]
MSAQAKFLACLERLNAAEAMVVTGGSSQEEVLAILRGLRTGLRDYQEEVGEVTPGPQEARCRYCHHKGSRSQGEEEDSTSAVAELQAHDSTTRLTSRPVTPQTDESTNRQIENSSTTVPSHDDSTTKFTSTPATSGTEECTTRLTSTPVTAHTEHSTITQNDNSFTTLPGHDDSTILFTARPVTSRTKESTTQLASRPVTPQTEASTNLQIDNSSTALESHDDSAGEDTETDESIRLPSRGDPTDTETDESTRLPSHDDPTPAADPQTNESTSLPTHDDSSESETDEPPPLSTHDDSSDSETDEPTSLSSHDDPSDSEMDEPTSLSSHDDSSDSETDESPPLSTRENSPDPETSTQLDSTTTTRLPSRPSPPKATNRPRSKWSLTIQEMGENLAANITKLMADETCLGLVSIADFDTDVDWADFAAAMVPPAKKRGHGVVYSKSSVSGVGLLGNAGSRTFQFPDMSQVSSEESPSREACLDYVRQLIDSPPKNAVPYYVGPPLYHDDERFTSRFDDLLHPGPALAEMHLIDGVNKPWLHAGLKGSGTAFHCEDADLGSYNLVLGGWKLWILIRESSHPAFEELVRKHWSCNRCEQFVRHNALLIGPETLTANDIEFDIHIAGPGDLVFTRPRQYHAVINVTPCVAIAVNFLPLGQPFLRKDLLLVVCPKCGLYNLDLEHLQKHMQRVSYRPMRTKTTTRTVSTTATATASNTAEKRKTAPTKSSPTKSKKAQTAPAAKDLQTQVDQLCKLRGNRPTTQMALKLVAAIRSPQAIHQFRDLVASMRDRGFHTARFDVRGDHSLCVLKLATNVNVSQRKSKLETFFVRLNQYHLAMVMDRLKLGRKRSDTEDITRVRQCTGWNDRQYAEQRTRGNKWIRLCDGARFDGLLCFMFLHSLPGSDVSPDHYLNMSDQDLQVFHHLLLLDKQTESVCAAGQAFQRSLNSTSMDTEFYWEGQSVDVDVGVEEDPETLLASLKPFPTHPTRPTENVYDPGKYPHWPKPPNWPWDWPADPTSLPAGQSRCDLCRSPPCRCAAEPQRAMPRIKHFEGRRGLQAVANGLGQLAYRADGVIGVFAAELIPLDTRHHDGWALELVRDDIGGSVCQVYARDMGNSFRLLLNTAARESNAKFASTVVSGKWRIMVVATRDILDGEEITVAVTDGTEG